MRTQLLLHMVRRVSLVAMVALTACIPPTSPTDEDFDAYFREQSATMAGTWRGNSTGRDLDLLTLQLSLTQSGTSISGTGVMMERGVAGTRPITITGTYYKPDATLTIRGMQFEGHTVTATVTAVNSAGFLADTLVLTGESYERKLTVILSRN